MEEALTFIELRRYAEYLLIILGGAGATLLFFMLFIGMVMGAFKLGFAVTRWLWDC